MRAAEILKRTVIIILFTLFLMACKKEKPEITINLDSLPIKINIEKSYVFESGKDGFQYAYGTINSLSNGTLFLTAVRYPKILSDFKDRAEIISATSDDGMKWKDVNVIQKNVGVKNTTNPSLIEIKDGELIMSFSAINSTSNVDLYWKRSIDNGRTWNEPKEISQKGAGYHVAINDRLIFSYGRLILPVAFVDGDIFENYEKQEVIIYSSSNLGETWIKSKGISTGHSLMEPNIVPLNDQEFLMNMRTKKGSVYFARSHDRGKNWTMEKSNIPSPAAPQKIIKIPNTELLVMVWNNTKENFQSSLNNRSPLSIALSDDKGYSWRYVADIENSKDFDYSYPSVTFSQEQMLVLYYEKDKITNNKSSLKLAKIPLSVLKKYKDAI